MQQLQGFYDAVHIARRLGVKWTDVMAWTDKPTANFPLPIAVLRNDKGKDKPIWLDAQVPDLRAWLAIRLNLSNPEAHWSLIDRGEEQPGGHQDQMAMFDMKRQEEEPAGLFAVTC